MRYQLSQAELIEAVQHYLNEKVLKRPVTVTSVKPSDDSRLGGINPVLHVTVDDDLAQVPEDIRNAERDSRAA